MRLSQDEVSLINRIVRRDRFLQRRSDAANFRRRNISRRLLNREIDGPAGNRNLRDPRYAAFSGRTLREQVQWQRRFARSWAGVATRRRYDRGRSLGEWNNLHDPNWLEWTRSHPYLASNINTGF